MSTIRARDSLRSAAVVVALSASLSIPVAVGPNMLMVRRHPLIGNVSADVYGLSNAKISQFYREAGESYHDGHWDIPRLREIQREYLSYVGDHSALFVTNGIHDAVLKLMPIIERVAGKERIDPNVIAGVIEKESQGYMYAIGRVGELGLMQINPHAYPEILRKKDLYRNIFNPEVNIIIGTRILKECLRESHGNLEMALAIYNVGYGRIIHHMFLRTGRMYGNAVMHNSKSISNILRVDADNY